MSSTLRSAAIAVLGLTAASILNLELAGRSSLRPFDFVHVPTGEFARWTSLGHQGLVSDLYWLAAVQYVGEPHADERGWEKLYPVVDLVTDLDPRHGYAYQTAGIVLSAAGRIDESNRILEKGIERGPDYWSFPFYIAFNYWFYLGDLTTAARYAEMAARRPGASANISHLAVSLASKSGNPNDAVTLLSELRATVRDEATSERLDEQLKLAIVERDAQELERAVARFETTQGRTPFSLSELVTSGSIASIPLDPFGGSYQWDPSARRVRSSVNPFRFSRRDSPHTPRFHYRPGRQDP